MRTRPNILILTCTTALSLISARAFGQEVPTSWPTSRPWVVQVPADMQEQAAWWIHQASEKVPLIEYDESRNLAVLRIIASLVRCDPSVDPAAALAAMNATAMENADPYTFGRWHARVARAMSRTGKAEASAHLLELAFEKASECEDSDDIYSVQNLALEVIGESDGADAMIRAIETIPQPECRAEHYCDIITDDVISNLTPEQQDELLNRAIADYRRIINPQLLDRVARNITEAMVKHPTRIEGAWLWAKFVQDEGDRSDSYSNLALEYALRKDTANFQRALAEMEKLSGLTSALRLSGDAAKNFCFLAMGLYRTVPNSDWRPLLQRATDMAMELDAGDVRDDVLGTICYGWARCRGFDEAQAVLDRIESSFESDYARMDVAVELCKAGEFDRGEQLYRQTENDIARFVSVDEIFFYEVRAGREEHARSMFKQIEDPDEAVQAALGAIAGLLHSVDPRETPGYAF